MAGEGPSRLLRTRRGLPPELEEARAWIEGLARSYGLQFCETVFEMCDYDEINMVASYGGFPTRYPHWRFGMEFLRMQKSYEYGLSKIYEMVINTEPAYAYLLDNNLYVDQKLVMAHVFGHVDFFQNNAWFSKTNRKMLDAMANHATRVRRHIDREGVKAVEQWIDTCLSIENLIDPMRPHIQRERSADDTVDSEASRLPAKRYMDRYINPKHAMDAEESRLREEAERARGFPAEPQRDVLLFLLRHAPLERWQADILTIIRDEAYYFAPQAQTKIMNEGWASYWHTKLMTQHILKDSEVITYCDHHSGTVATRPGQLNPYKLGLELFRDIERRWDRGQFGKEWMDCSDYQTRKQWDTNAGLGRQKIFDVRRTHNDVTFLDTFLHPDFCRRHGLFTYEYNTRTKEYEIDTREFAAVKQKLLFMIANRGAPRIVVSDGNHANRGELELTHTHEGVDIQLDWAEQTLSNLARIWSRPVYLKTTVEDKPVLLSHDGESFKTEGLEAIREATEATEADDDSATTTAAAQGKP